MLFNKTSAILLLTIISSLHMKGESKRSSCPYEGYYKNPEYNQNKRLQRCLRCSACPPGEGVLRACIGSNDTVCVPCVKGTFSSSWSKRDQCRPCTACAPFQSEKYKCSADQDTKCGKCKTGYYFNSILDQCNACSYCFPDVIASYMTLVVADCVRKEIPSDFQCGKLTRPPYAQKTWAQQQRELEESTEASGDDVTFNPNDDEDVTVDEMLIFDNERDNKQNKQISENNKITATGSPKLSRTSAIISAKVKKAISTTTTTTSTPTATSAATTTSTETTTALLRNKKIRHLHSSNSKKSKGTFQDQQTITLVLLGTVSGLLVWLLVVTVLLIYLYRKIMGFNPGKIYRYSSNCSKNSLLGKEI